MECSHIVTDRFEGGKIEKQSDTRGGSGCQSPFLTSHGPQTESSHSQALVFPISDWRWNGVTQGEVAFPDTA